MKLQYNCIDSLKSARYIVPIILELVNPRSVVDVGCGTGEFLYIFKEQGINDILGIDNEKLINKKRLSIPNNLFISANLERPLKIDRSFDLVVSLEVAEHLPKTSAKMFVDTLTSLGHVILFSAAIPFQGGVHHINEQWQNYWAELFKLKGYVPIDIIRKKIWDNDEVSFWYSQNIILFVKKNYVKKNKILQEEYEKTCNLPLSIVHPKLYLSKAKIHNFIVKLIPIKSSILKLEKIIFIIKKRLQKN